MRVCPVLESVEVKSCSSVSAETQMMLSNSIQTAGENTTDPTESSGQEVSPEAAAMENSPTENQSRGRKKKGIRAFFGQIGKAVKRCTLCCHEDNILTPACNVPVDPHTAGRERALSISHCPFGIQLTTDSDLEHPEPPSVSGPSSLELTPDSDLAPSLVPPPARLNSELALDPDLSSLVSELMFIVEPVNLEVTPVPSLSSIEITPDVDPADPEPSSISGPSAQDSGITPVPDPSGCGLAVEEQINTKKGIGTFFRRTWRSVKNAVLCSQRSNKVAPDPSGVTGQHSEDLLPAVEKQTKRKKKKDIMAFFWRTCRTIKFSALCCDEGNTVALDPCGTEPAAPQASADLQSCLSDLSWVLTYPCLFDFELTLNPYTASPGPLTVPDPSGLEPMVNQDPVDFQPDLISFDSQSTLGPSLSDLSEFMSLSGPSSHKVTPVSSSSSLESTPDTCPSDPELKPVPGSPRLELTPDVDLADPEPSSVSGPSSHKLTLNPSDFWPAAGSFSTLYDVGVMLGRGGFGVVNEATRRSNGQKVAVKFVNKRNRDSFINLPGCTEPLLAEVAVNLVLHKPPKCPYIVQMLDWFDEPQRFIIIMEYPRPCKTLLSFIMHNRGSLGETVAQGLFRQAVLGAKHCFDRGVCHNDIKSDNILVNTETLQLKFIDFGCSELITSTNYKAYEWAMQGTVWSLGLLLFQMVWGDEPLSVLLSGTHSPLIPHMSNELQDLARQCMSRDQTKRPTLEQILQHEWFQQDRQRQEAQESGGVT